MKKSALFILSALAAFSAYAADRQIGLHFETPANSSTNNDIFVGENGKSYFTTSLKDQYRNLTMVGGAYVGTLEVKEGVEAIINITNQDIDGYSSPNVTTSNYRFGGSANSVAGSATVFGAGVDKSTLTFYGSAFDTGHAVGDTEAAKAKDTMTVRDITINFNGANQFGSNNLVLNSAVVNINSGYVSPRTLTTSLTNSELNILSTSNTISKLGDLTMVNSKIDGGTKGVTVGALTLDNTTATFDGANVKASSLALTGVNNIKGNGSFSTSEIDLKAKTLYVTTANFSSAFSGYGNSTTSAILYIGKDSDGGTSKVNYNGSIMFNFGAVEVHGGSTIGTTTRGELRLADHNEHQSYFAKDSKVYVTHSRIMNAYIDGLIDTSGRQTAGGGWDYALTLGVYSTGGRPSTRGTITLDKNAELNVNSDAATYFGLYGDITSSAGAGKLVSSDLAPLTIYGDTVLTLNSSDAFAVGGAASQAESVFNFYDASTAKLVVNKANSIGSLSFGDAAKLTLEFGENGSLVLGDSVVDSLSGILVDDMITLSGDLYKKLKVYDLTDEQINQYFTSVNGIYLQDAGNGAYWVNTVIPEPAEWAAIFGAIALGFVAYRRRK